MWLSYYFCSLSICIYTECLNIQEADVTAINSTNNDVVFFCIANFKTVYNNNY